MLHHPHRVIAGLFAALAVGACVESPYRTSNYQEVKGDSASVIVTHTHNEAEGRPLAEDYCRAQGAAARFKGIVQYRTKRETTKGASFECYGPPASSGGRLDDIPSSQRSEAKWTSSLIDGHEQVPLRASLRSR